MEKWLNYLAIKVFKAKSLKGVTLIGYAFVFLWVFLKHWTFRISDTKYRNCVQSIVPINVLISLLKMKNFFNSGINLCHCFENRDTAKLYARNIFGCEKRKGGFLNQNLLKF
jgi:hypothetical protein